MTRRCGFIFDSSGNCISKAKNGPGGRIYSFLSDAVPCAAEFSRSSVSQNARVRLKCLLTIVKSRHPFRAASMPDETPNREALIAEIEVVERYLAAVRETRRPFDRALKVVREICRKRSDESLRAWSTFQRTFTTAEEERETYVASKSSWFWSEDKDQEYQQLKQEHWERYHAAIHPVAEFSLDLMRDIECETDFLVTVKEVTHRADAFAKGVDVYSFYSGHSAQSNDISDIFPDPTLLDAIPNFSVPLLIVGESFPTALCIFKSSTPISRKKNHHKWFSNFLEKLLWDVTRAYRARSRAKLFEDRSGHPSHTRSGYGGPYQPWSKLELERGIEPDDGFPLTTIDQLGVLNSDRDSTRRARAHLDRLKLAFNHLDVITAKQRTKAAAMAYFGKTRELADSIKKNLKSQIEDSSRCPYCNGELGESPHADHIYPVSLGGLSTIENMVLICASCNLAKSNKTLRQFIFDRKLNRAQVEIRLERLGKQF